MESLDNKKQFNLPSKRFLIRGGIATGIIAIILIVQTEWFLGLFNKKPHKIDPNATVGDIVAKDSNGNGIPDWEERLWGLDPTELYTGDMSNKEIIDNKKKALGLTIEGDENLNETDRLARQLFSISTSLGQEGATIDDIGSAGTALGNNVSIIRVSNQYEYSDIKTTKTTATSLRQYYKSISTAIGKNIPGQSKFSTVITALESGDYSNIGQLSEASITYKQLSKTLSQIPAPIGLNQYHLDMINGFYGIGESFSYIATMETDSITALNGLAIYKEYSLKLDFSWNDMTTYLKEYDIL